MVKKNIKNTILKNNLINAGEHIVLGLSGGPDSVCLFYVLNELKTEMDFSLHAVHVNHGFRGAEADEDQLYVEQLCRAAGAECTVYTYDCNAIAEKEGLSSEEAGRKVRYEAFSQTAGLLADTGIPAGSIKIAVAHNADDQAETVLFRLLRGTGPDGLAAMAYSRTEGEFCIIRPLLDTWRSDIEDYCSQHGLYARTDRTNLQPVYTRNKIRLELIPYLQEQYNVNIKESLCRLSRIACEDKEYLWQCAEKAFSELLIDGAPLSLQQKGLAELPASVRHRVVMKALREQGMVRDVSYSHLEAVDSVLGKTGESKTVELPDGYRISVRYGEVAFYRSEPGCSCAPEKQTATFDYDKIKAVHGDAEIVFRTRRPGDYIAIGGAVSAGRKKLQNLFVDMKVPKEYRDHVLVAAAGSEIIWLPEQPEKGVKRARYSHNYKLDENTKNPITIETVCEI